MRQHPMAVSHFAQQHQPLLAKPLKAVWIIARPERAAAQDAHAALRQTPGDGLHLLAAFDHARAGHHHHLLAADRHVSDLDLRPFGFESARGQFVRRADAHYLVDAFEQFQFARVSDARAYRAEQRVARSGRAVNVETEFDQTIHDPDDLLLGRVLFHYDDHKNSGQWAVGSGQWDPATHGSLSTAHYLLLSPFFLARFNAFDPPRLVYHALEEAADGFGFERAFVRGGDVGNDLRFAS